MKITSIRISAFRGINRETKFNFKDSEIIVLYGPNGHGKSSVFDAIEWGLTGRIHRFDEANSEKRRYSFIRNLNATKETKTFVEIEMALKDNTLITIYREIVAKSKSDYGKSELTLSVSSYPGDKYRDKEAEEILEKFLVKENWREKIDSTNKMLSLTHILSQEKLAEFVRGTNEKERYNSVSFLFGTDQFKKYRNLFMDKTNQLLEIKNKIEKKISNLDGAISQLTQQISSCEYNEDETGIKDFEEDLQKLLKFIPGIVLVDGSDPKIEELLITYMANNDSKIKNVRETILQNELMQKRIPEYLKALSLRKELDSKLKYFSIFKVNSKEIEELDQMFKDVDRIAISYQMREEQKSKLNKCKVKQSKLIQLKKNNQTIINTINHITEGASNNPLEDFDKIREFLSNSQIFELENLLKELLVLKDRLNAIEQEKNEKKEQKHKISLSISKIEKMSDAYSVFLSNISNYLESLEGEIDTCPTCGNEGVSKKQILEFVSNQQLKFDNDLPELTNQLNAILKNTSLIDEVKEEIIKGEKNIKNKLNEIIFSFSKKNVEIDSDIHTITNLSIEAQLELDAINRETQEFTKKCLARNISMDKNTSTQISELREKIISQNKEIVSKLNQSSINNDNLVFNVSYSMDALNDYESKLNSLDIDNRKNINILSADLKFEEPLTENNYLRISSDLEKFYQNNYQVLIDLNSQNDLIKKAQLNIELNRRNKEYMTLKKDREHLELELKELNRKKGKIDENISVLNELKDGVPKAISSLNNSILSELNESIQAFYGQLNMHPIFSNLDFYTDTANKNNYLNIIVKSEKNVEANAQLIFSSAQINAVALSIFFAMSINQNWTDLNILALDDPIQSLDEINLVSFIDLLRLFCRNYDRQIIISTHDYSFFKLLQKKFRYFQTRVFDYSAYSLDGPSIREYNAKNIVCKNDKSYHLEYLKTMDFS